MNGCVVSRSRVDSRRVPPTIPSIYYLYSLEQRMQILRAHFRACCQFEFDKDCYVQEYVKAQFAGVETHVAIIDLLRRVQPSSSRWPSKTKEIIGRPVMRSLWPITSARRGERLYNISSC